MAEDTDHDLLVRLDEKMDGMSKVLTTLVTSLDQRGADIEDLKTAKLLHEQETKQEKIEFLGLKDRVSILETKVDNKFTVVDNNILTLKGASIMLWAQRHPKIAWALTIVFLIMLNLHDIIVPWIFSLFGYKTP